MRQRLNAFEEKESPLLFGKSRSEYWTEVEATLKSAETQRDYARLLEFEEMDLQIREKRQRCYLLLKEGVEQNQTLLDLDIQNREERILAYLGKQREDIEGECGEREPANRISMNEREMDLLELEVLSDMEKDILKKGENSYFIQNMIDSFF